ncbi:Para-nitrobenzyl esterase [Echinococcus granulosus]|uniref:Para-nitrobenzyl esterase n=1 Tax=Echinococcus granulosus TaxID=6210 RepID=U6JC01_ECHGR|nr:Para-nitrobenzyl esterase [Echinococcus granulosus]EUB56580.1 Para-nitrobenzyl esterase [Echinococcus granulosus]CDS21574.1 para nitrobenzyl esterase [Echinococcus granulosus]
MSAVGQSEYKEDKRGSFMKQNSFSSEATLSLSNFKVSFLDRKVPLLLCVTATILIALIAVSIYAVYVSLFLHGYILISKESNVETRCGVVKGFISNDIVHYLGVPYALPPIGTRRFRKPVELTTNALCLEAWNTPQHRQVPVLDAFTYRNVCMQLLPISNEIIGSEDCLYLNIFVPRTHKPEELHPVIFIIGGFFFNYGGSSNGSTFLHHPDPETIINLNAIQVTSNYRLGPFGFLTHPSTKVANIGVRDQLAALRWVRSNIRYFGGDPLKITVFSYGSGATISLALLGSPLAQNLFEKAWISAPALRKPEITLTSAVDASRNVFKCEHADCDQKGEDILRLWNWTIVEPWIEQLFTLPSASNIHCLPGLPCRGGILVIDDEVITNVSWNSPLSPIPIVLGQNSHEAEAYPFPNTVQLWNFAIMSGYIKNILGENSSEFKLINDYYLLKNTAIGIASQNHSSNWPSIVDKYSQIVTDIRVTCPLQSYARSLRRVQPILRYYIRSQHAHFNPYGLDSFVSSAFHGWDAFLLFKIFRYHPDYIYAVNKSFLSDKSLEKLSDNFCTSLKHFVWRGTMFPGKKNTLLTIFENEIVYSTSVDDISMCQKWNDLLSHSPYLYAWKA